AFAPIRDMQRRMLLATIFLTLLAGGLTWWMLRRQLSPMLAAVKTLAALSDTNQPAQPLPIARQDEIGELIGGFNRLLETLAHREEALRESEERFRSLSELSSDFYWESDAEHRLLARGAGSKPAIVSAFKDDAQLGLRHWEIPYVSPDEAGWQAHRAVLDAHLPFRGFELSRLGPDGTTVRHILISGDPLFDASGAFKGYRGVGTDITERKQAEATRDQLAAIVENSSDAIFSRTLDGTIVSWNAGAEKMFGYGAAEAIGKPSTFNLLPGRQPILARNTERILRGETIPPRESQRVTKDGRVIDLLGRLSPVKDSAGKIIGASVILHDITERKRMEEALRATSEQLQTLIHSVPLAIFTRDKNRLVTSWSPAAEQIYGWKASEVLGKPLPTVPGEAREESALVFPKVLAGAQLVERQIQRLRRDGAPIFINAATAPLRDASGAISGVITIASDITARKKAEATRDQLAAIVENSNDAIFSRTLEGTIVSWNAGAEKMLGYSATEAIGKPSTFQLLPGQQISSARNNERILRGETIAPHELQCVTKDGRVIDVLSSVSPIRDSAGKIIGAAVIFHDITERKRAEAEVRRLHEELQRHAAELEQRVAERTAQLAAAKERAEAADKVKSSFLATMSHELRTPLNSVIGFTGILLQKLPGPLNAEQEKQLGMVQSAARHLLALINDVLDISKVEAGELRLEHAPFDLGSLLERLGATFAPEAARRGLAFSLEP
ncbi:MAG: PAS domain S-box protein, partial [Pseudomonadota bacterium]